MTRKTQNNETNICKTTEDTIYILWIDFTPLSLRLSIVASYILRRTIRLSRVTNKLQVPAFPLSAGTSLFIPQTKVLKPAVTIIYERHKVINGPGSLVSYIPTLTEPPPRCTSCVLESYPGVCDLLKMNPKCRGSLGIWEIKKEDWVVCFGNAIRFSIWTVWLFLQKCI